MINFLLNALIIIALFLNLPALANKNNDKLNISGTYKCSGFDNYEGHFESELKFSLDEKMSEFNHNYGTYQLQMKAVVNKVTEHYNGYAAVHGDIMAVYFENTNPASVTDRGVGIAHITHTIDKNGKYSTNLSKFYYTPQYKRDATDGKGRGGMGGFGTENCLKVKNSH